MTKKYSKLSSLLKKLLFERNMKPTELARAVDLPIPTVHRLVTGKSTRPHINSLKPIADFFGISIEEIKDEKNIKQITPFASMLSNPSQIMHIPLLEWVSLDCLHNLKKHTPHIKPLQ